MQEDVTTATNVRNVFSETAIYLLYDYKMRKIGVSLFM